MRLSNFIAALTAIGVALGGSAWAEETAPAAKRVDLNWQTIQRDDGDKAPKSAIAAKLAAQQSDALPKREPLRRFRDPNGDWVIGHRAPGKLSASAPEQPR